MVPSKDYSHAPPCLRGLLGVKGERPKTNSRAHKKKTMKTKKQRLKGLKSRAEQLSTEATAEPKLLDVPAQPSAEPKPDGRLPIDLERRRANRRLSTDRLLALLRCEAPRFFEVAEVVGKWVWVQFTEKQPREVTALLSELGFHWNNTRQTWQHPCGTYRDEAALYDPRKKYRAYFAADQKAA